MNTMMGAAMMGAAILVTTVSTATVAVSQGFSGYCLDLGSAGCTARYIPFRNMSLDFCEETCTLTNPVSVNGMSAVLYELSCVADYNTPLDGSRVFIIEREEYGARIINWIDNRQILGIGRC